MADLEITRRTTPETDAMNMVIIDIATRFNAAEEKTIRAMLADAWDDGHRVGRNHPVSGHWNPYRDKQ